jgi:putative membrane protein
MDSLAGGADSLADGARQSADGAGALADGTEQAADGITELTDVMQTAVDAGSLVEAQAGTLADSGTELADEADALADRLASSADGTGTYEPEARTRMGELAADPVGLDTTRVSAFGGPQTGLAPFMMAVAAWVGSLAAFLVLPAVWRRDDRRWVRAVLAALGAAAALSVAGSVLMALGMRYLVGVEAADLLQLLGFAVLVALAFTAVVQALVALFGSRGWLVALLFLVVQVAASGVPLSAAAAPGPLAALSPFVPLTYAIDAFHGAIAGAGSSPGIDAFVLGAWLLASVLVTLAAAARSRNELPAGELAAA